MHDIAILPHSLHGYTYKYHGVSSIDIGNGLDLNFTLLDFWYWWQILENSIKHASGSTGCGYTMDFTGGNWLIVNLGIGMLVGIVVKHQATQWDYVITSLPSKINPFLHISIELGLEIILNGW